MPIVIVLGSLDLGTAILSTATLSFLGLGAQPPQAEWGAMLSAGREFMRYAPWTMIFRAWRCSSRSCRSTWSATA